VKHRKISPVIQLFLILLLVTFLVLMQFCIMILSDNLTGDFYKIRNSYSSELLITTVISISCSILILYHLIKSYHPPAKLTEPTALLSWQYSKEYWEKIKKENLTSISLLELRKELLSCALVGALAYLLLIIENKTLSISLLSLLIVFSVPVIPFTLGRYIKEKTCQFFKGSYHVKIYRRGLTINDVYFPFNGQ